MLTLTYQFKLKPNKEQIRIIEKTLEVTRKVWNYALVERKDWYKGRKSPVNSCSIISEYIIPADAPYPNYNYQAKQLTIAKKDYAELKEVNAQVLQQTLKRLEQAFKDMKDRNFGFPRFKKPGRMRSYIYPQMLKNALRFGEIKLPQLGWVKFKQSRAINDDFDLKQARIIKKATGYFVQLILQVELEVPQPIPFGKAIGIDLGLESFLATSLGHLIERPRFFKTLHRQLKLLQRRLKKKLKGSANWHKLQQKIAKLHQKIAETRKDFHFKVSHYLCDMANQIYAEEINFVAWGRNLLAKHNLDAGFGQFIEILSYVCWRRGVYFEQVNKDFTSQECPECGYLCGQKKLSERVHFCPLCGYQKHRDIAAAEVIRNRGLKLRLGAVGQPVPKQNACGEVLTGVREVQYVSGLVKTRLKQESPVIASA